MSKLSISDAWTMTAEQLRRDGKLFLPIALLLIGLPGAAFQLLVPQEAWVAALKSREFQPVFLLVIPMALLSLYGSMALTAMTLVARVSVGEALRLAAGRFVTLFAARMILGLGFAAAVLLAMLAIAASRPVGALLLIAAGVGILYTYVRFLLIEPVTIAEPLSPVAVLRRSWELTAGSFWRLLGFMLVFIVGSVVLSFVAGMVGGVLAVLFEKGLSFPAGGTVLAVLLPALASAVISTVYVPLVANIYRQRVAAAAPS